MPRIARWFALALALSLSACIEGSTSAPAAVSAVGTWDLQTVDGSPLPLVVSQGDALGGRLSWERCTLTLSIDGKVAGQSIYFDGGSIIPVAHRGTYVRSGLALTITYDNGETSPGTISGGTLTLISGGTLTLTMSGTHTLVFGRR